MLRPSPRRAPLRVQRVHRCWLVGPRPPCVADELDRVIALMTQHPVTDILGGPHALGATGLALAGGQVLLDHITPHRPRNTRYQTSPPARAPAPSECPPGPTALTGGSDTPGA